MNFDIKKKSVKIMLVAAIGLIFFAFLPFVSAKMSAMGQSETDSASFFSSLFEDGFVLPSLVGLICLAAFVGIIATAYMKKTNENLLCCLAGGGAGVLMFIVSLLSFGSLEDKAKAALGQYGSMVEVSLGGGIGFWIGILALIACAAMAFLLPEDAQ